MIKRIRQWFCGHRYGFWVYQKPVKPGDKPVEHSVCRKCDYLRVRDGAKKAERIAGLRKAAEYQKALGKMLENVADVAEKPLSLFAEISAWSAGMAHLSMISSAPLKPFVGKGKPTKASADLKDGEELIVLSGASVEVRSQAELEGLFNKFKKRHSEGDVVIIDKDKEKRAGAVCKQAGLSGCNVSPVEVSVSGAIMDRDFVDMVAGAVKRGKE